jgi:hypothetical protein
MRTATGPEALCHALAEFVTAHKQHRAAVHAGTPLVATWRRLRAAGSALEAEIVARRCPTPVEFAGHLILFDREGELFASPAHLCRHSGPRRETA